jgi:hypothetical protein
MRARDGNKGKPDEFGNADDDKGGKAAPCRGGTVITFAGAPGAVIGGGGGASAVDTPVGAPLNADCGNVPVGGAKPVPIPLGDICGPGAGAPIAPE